MTRTYVYELWDGKKAVGTYSIPFPIFGLTLVVPEVSILKQKYGCKLKVIKLPVISVVYADDGVEYRVKRVLDVRRKSKRQIEFLKGTL